MKKIFRIFQKKIIIYFVKFFNILLKKSNYNVVPLIDQLNEFKFNYPEDTRRLVLEAKKNSFDKILIDTTLLKTELCDLGKKFNTNKSPYNLSGHRSGYTGVYYLLFNSLKNKKFNLAEIGIEKNGSTKLWREYFKNASLYLFEKDKNKIKEALADKLENCYYNYIDVDSTDNITNSLNKCGKKFDIIIDDSTHLFRHQINIIQTTKEFLNSGGFLVIEDIFRLKENHSEKNYYSELSNIKNEFSEIFFIETKHANNFTASWKCEKLLILKKK